MDPKGQLIRASNGLEIESHAVQIEMETKTETSIFRSQESGASTFSYGVALRDTNKKGN